MQFHDKEDLLEPDYSNARAYIDEYGDLIVQSAQPEYYASVFLSRFEGTGAGKYHKFDPENPANRKVYFPGDTITVTF